MKKVGILGGMSPESTVLYYGRVTAHILLALVITATRKF